MSHALYAFGGALFGAAIGSHVVIRLRERRRLAMIEMEKRHGAS